MTSKWAKGTGGPSGDEAQNLVTDSPAVLMTMREGKPGGGKGPLLVEEESLTLATGNGQTLFQPQAFDGYNQTLSDTAQTIRADKSDGDHVGMVLEPQAFDEMNFTTSDQHHVLRAGTKQSTGVVQPVAFRKSSRAQSSDDAPTVGPTQYGVRRLTPVECERLQAFPDDWTEPAGSDSARYKALGNAVTVNTVWWILRRMKAQG